MTFRIDASSDRLLIGWLAVPGDHADHPALTLLAEVLCNAPSTRLERALVQEGQLATEIDCELPSWRAAALFEVRVVLRPGVRASAAETLVAREIAALRAGTPVTEAELRGARSRLSRERYASLAASDGRAAVLGEAVACFGDPGHAERWWRGVQAVTVADLTRVAATWLVPKRATTVLGVAADAPREATR